MGSVGGVVGGAPGIEGRAAVGIVVESMLRKKRMKRWIGYCIVMKGDCNRG